MSGDNYTSCPKCTAKAKADADKMAEKVKKSYGKVSEKQYQELRRQLAHLKERALAHNVPLREDYQIGIREGLFQVRYNACCNACDFRFEHNVRIEIK